MRNRAVLAAALTAFLGLMGALAQAQSVQGAKKYDLNIQRQSLDAALKDLAAQTRLQIGRFSDAVRGDMQVGPLSGSLTVDEALRSLLAPSGLVYAPLNNRGYIVLTPAERKRQASSSLSQSSGARAAGAGNLQLASVADPQDMQRVQTAEDKPATNTVSQEEETGGELTVTGSRIRGAQQHAAPMTIIDRETIERRGFSTVEDIIRSLPQNLATMNSARSVTQPVGADGLPVGPAAQGEVIANLRGLGQSATLVLINGRRTAGSAAFAGSSVNLASIPVASIERVEILPDSAAAVYGSDAIAGVINIILREDYRGSSTSVRSEDGMNGGDKWSVDQVVGYAWGSGNVTATLSWSDTKPINTARTGYVTNDFRSRGGYDNRNDFFTQPGSVERYELDEDGNFIFDEDGNFVTTPLGTLPASFSGTENWTLADLSLANLDDTYGDWVPLEQSSRTQTRAAYVNIKQALSESVDGFLGVRYTQDKVKALGNPPLVALDVGPDNPYNNLGVPLLVSYIAEHEVTAGLIPYEYSSNTLRNLSFEAGVTMDLPLRDWRTDASMVHSISESRSGGMGYNTFFNFDPALAAALNPFGNGTAQNLQAILDTYAPKDFVTDRKTKLSGLTVSADGSFAQLKSGNLRGALGAEYRLEGLDFGDDDYIADGNLTDRQPEQSIMAVFAETLIPLAPRLTGSLQGRWERYEVDSTDSIIDGRTFEKFSPRVGLTWDVGESLTLRGSWGKAFKAPNLTNLVVTNSVGTFPSVLFDPVMENFVPVFFDSVGNPQLSAESGETVNLGFDWRPQAIPGLHASLTYNSTEFSNRIVGSLTNLPGLGLEELLTYAEEFPDVFPGVVVRDPVTNNLQRIRSFPYNVSAMKVDAMDFDVQLAREIASGEFRAGLQGTYVLKHAQQIVSILPTEELQGTTAADRFIAALSLGWSRQGYGLDVNGRYTNAYWNTEIVNVIFNQTNPPMRVRSRTTWDLTGYYEFGDGWRVSAGARNLFDEEFPFHQGFAGPYDTRRVDLRGRLLFGEVRKEFSF